ncbi:MAG TPA: DUF6766 family protein [Flavisolibacter sp.]|jgi:hypothetical protein|nr:DUF6766 family protein [Flavisolibacter sp.]
MKTLKNNSLSLIFLLLFLFSMAGQVFNGLKEHNQEMKEQGGKQVTLGEYFSTGHFFQSTFENWESEFLQMALFVVGTIFLYQKGSSESKDPDKKEEVDREPDPKRKNAPWPVKQGGLMRSFYSHSLSLSLFALFLASFLLHWYGSMKDFNEEQVLKHLPKETAWQYLGNARLWFESFQNWQSEFLSVFAIVILSVYLREKGSAQSKPVDAPFSETGD